MIVDTEAKQLKDIEEKELLTKLYIDEKLGAPSIALKLRVSKAQAYILLKKHGIKTRNFDQAMRVKKKIRSKTFRKTIL